MLMHRLLYSGRPRFNACGKMMFMKVCTGVKPSAKPASVCPCGTASSEVL